MKAPRTRAVLALLLLGLSCDEASDPADPGAGLVPLAEVEAAPAPRLSPLLLPQEPADPLLQPPPRDNPGGVDGDRPERELLGRRAEP